MDECKSSFFFPPRREKKSPSVTNGAIINRANDKLVLHCISDKENFNNVVSDSTWGKNIDFIYIWLHHYHDI